MIVVSTLAFLINLFLAVAFLRRGQNIASGVSLSIAALSATFIGLWISAIVISYNRASIHDFMASVFEGKPTHIREYEDKKERKEQEEKKAQEQKVNQKNETEWVCTIVDDQKICTRNQEKKAREDETSDSDWDCVTEGNRKICIKHGAEKWY